MIRREEPGRMVVLSSGLGGIPNYYDAAATVRERDFGGYIALAPEDFYFSSATRSIAIGRMRREVRNNPYLAGLCWKYPQCIGYSNLRSRTTSKTFNAKKDLWWFRWSKSVTNRNDSLRKLEKIIKTELLLAGEVFLILLSNGRVQLVPSEFCGSPIGATTSNEQEINGIIYGDNGLPTAYRFGKISTGGLVNYEEGAPIPARYVIHIFDKDRVQMGRGLPWLLACLATARDLYEITRSKTKQIKDANMISGTLETERSADILPGLQVHRDKVTEQVKTESKDDPADPVKKGPIMVELRSGSFISLEPGEKLNLLKSQYEASDYKELIMLMLHAMSSPIGFPVELWFSGLGDVNYSGFKGLGTQWDGARQDVCKFLEDDFLGKLHFWRISKAVLDGELPKNPDDDDDLVEWAWRQTPVLDEEKHSKANKTKLQSGEASLEDIWAEQGLFAEEVFAARRELWIKLMLAAGDLKPGDDFEAVKVPKVFLLRGLLPGENPIANLDTIDPKPPRAEDDDPNAGAVPGSPPPADPADPEGSDPAGKGGKGGKGKK